MNALERMYTYLNNNTTNDTYSGMIKTIISNAEAVVNGTIYDAAELCFTSPASIGRMCRLLHYNGFTEFKIDLSEVYRNYSYHNHVFPTCRLADTQGVKTMYSDNLHHIADLMKVLEDDKIDAFLELIHESKTVYLCDYLSSSDCLLSLQSNLAMDDKMMLTVNDYTGFEKRMESLSDDSLVVFLIPNIPEAEFLWRMFNKAARVGLRTVVISFVDNSKDFSLATLDINFGGTCSIMDKFFIEPFLLMLSQLYRKRYMKI